MLSGQVIGISEAVVISLIGVLIVMLELALLACFIIILSKVMSALGKEKNENAVKAAPAPCNPAPECRPEVSVLGTEEESELAIIMTTVLEECGLDPCQVVFRSITRVH